MSCGRHTNLCSFAAGEWIPPVVPPWPTHCTSAKKYGAISVAHSRCSRGIQENASKATVTILFSSTKMLRKECCITIFRYMTILNILPKVQPLPRWKVARNVWDFARCNFQIGSSSDRGNYFVPLIPPDIVWLL
jgi:hypothetical protein